MKAKDSKRAREERLVRKFLSRIECLPDEWDGSCGGPDFHDVAREIRRTAKLLDKP